MMITDYKKKLAAYEGLVRKPADFEHVWHQRMKTSVREVIRTRVPFCNETAIYEQMQITHEHGTIYARVIRPTEKNICPTVLMYHDLGRGIRGWHHMTRFIALGYAVVALQAEPSSFDWQQNPEAAGFENRYRDALILADCTLGLPFVDRDRITTWGEGFGGALAIAAAAMLPVTVKCAALNPMPADLRTVCAAEEAVLNRLDYVDAANFAPLIRGEVLLGICLMDAIALPEGQYAVFNRLTCSRNAKVYPKYAHERVNFFENEFVNFLHD